MEPPTLAGGSGWCHPGIQVRTASPAGSGLVWRNPGGNAESSLRTFPAAVARNLDSRRDDFARGRAVWPGRRRNCSCRAPGKSRKQILDLAAGRVNFRRPCRPAGWPWFRRRQQREPEGRPRGPARRTSAWTAADRAGARTWTREWRFRTSGKRLQGTGG